MGRGRQLMNSIFHNLFLLLVLSTLSLLRARMSTHFPDSLKERDEARRFALEQQKAKRQEEKKVEETSEHFNREFESKKNGKSRLSPSISFPLLPSLFPPFLQSSSSILLHDCFPFCSCLFTTRSGREPAQGTTSFSF